MKKTLLLLTGILLLSISAIVALYYFTTQKTFLNNFVRKFPPAPLRASKIIDIGYSSFYFAGASQEKVFLGNSVAPLYVFSTDAALTDTALLKLELENHQRTHLKSAQIAVNTNRIYLLDGVTPAIFESIPQKGAHLRQTSSNNKIYFTQAAPMGPTSLAIRTFDAYSRQNILARASLAGGTSFNPAPGILQKQVDGIFCTDGNLIYDSASARLIYTYMYRNQFICMDSSLNILYRANTIDTISHAQIKVGSIKSQNAVTLAAPPKVVNRQSCVYKKWLFVNSNITADNENKDAAKLSSVIDVYNLEDGKYRYSFYLFNLGGKRMHSFGVAHGKIFALHDHHLVAYSLNSKYLDENKETWK